MNATEQYFLVMLFIMLYKKVVLTCKSVNKILKCEYSNECYRAVLSCDVVYYSIQGGFYF